jgi:cell wall assembly regulator SMI1
MKEIWRRIERWLAANAPEALEALRPPAATEDMRALERSVGAPLPDDFRESLFVHDGQEPELPVFGPWALLALRQIDQYRAVNRNASIGPSGTYPATPEGPVLPLWWSDGWIPFAEDGAGNDLCLDVRPPTGGAIGQIVEFVHDAPVRALVAPSFTAWLSGVADDMEGGRYQLTRLGWPIRRDG